MSPLSPTRLVGIAVLAHLTVLLAPMIGRADAGPDAGPACRLDDYESSATECRACQEAAGATPRCHDLLHRLQFRKKCSDDKTPISTEIWCRTIGPGSPPVPPKVTDELEVAGRRGGCGCEVASGGAGNGLALTAAAMVLAGWRRRRRAHRRAS